MISDPLIELRADKVHVCAVESWILYHVVLIALHQLIIGRGIERILARVLLPPHLDVGVDDALNILPNAVQHLGEHGIRLGRVDGPVNGKSPGIGPTVAAADMHNRIQIGPRLALKFRVRRPSSPRFPDGPGDGGKLGAGVDGARHGLGFILNYGDFELTR